MTKILASTGSFNSDVSQVMTHVRKPVFVDNAVHHALVTSQADNKHKVSIESRNNATYNVFSQNSYELVEGESFVQLTHTKRPGHTSTQAPFYQDETMSSSSKKPILLYDKEDTSKRLSFSSIEDSDEGVTLNVMNMKGRVLKDVGFTGKAVHLGDPVDVGLRTSDLAMRLGTDVTGTLTSVSIGELRSAANSNDGRRKHTTKFLAEDFYGITLLRALRFSSRHDSNTVYFDRFANLLYTPFTFSESTRMLPEEQRLGPESSNPVEHNENRVSVQGNPMSLNEIASITLDDGERQQGKFDLDVQETTEPIFDATVKTNADARRVARQILKANSIYKGSLTSGGHLDAWDLRPGKKVEYKGRNRLVTESTHKLTSRESDFKFLTMQKGIDSVLQQLSDGMASPTSKSNPDTITQKTEKNISLFSSVEILSSVNVVLRGVEAENTKFLIGPASGNATLGGAQKGIGVNKMGTSRYRGDR
tara:strand:+ start:1284 stop:2714 length:1431 start_codon:yes stop_codon:yes gene_type:complete